MGEEKSIIDLIINEFEKLKTHLAIHSITFQSDNSLPIYFELILKKQLSAVIEIGIQNIYFVPMGDNSYRIMFHQIPLYGHIK